MIIAHTDINDLEHKWAPMSHHMMGLQYTRSGYGSRIPLPWLVRLPGSPVWRRVYCCVYSNAGTAYVQVNKGKDWHVITGTPKQKG